MLSFGLIGNPVSHSQSRIYFTEKFQREHIDADYGLYQLDCIEDFPALCQQHDFKGLNVTAPYKQAIVPYLDQLDESAACIGAVNVIRFTSEGLKIGYNTDLIGFRESIRTRLKGRKKALVFGTGGASHAVCAALNQLNLKSQVVSRQIIHHPSSIIHHQSIPYSAVTPALLQEYTLLINATPLGMTPHEEELPSLSQACYASLGPAHLLYDLVYNPPLTPFLRVGQQQGATIMNGQEMHRLQAEASWKIWTTQITIRPATIDDAPFIAQQVLRAITLRDDIEASAVAELTPICAQTGTLYSYRNALIAEIDELGSRDCKSPVGLALAYPGADYHTMRTLTFPQISYFQGTDPDSMPDETEGGEYYLDSLAVDPRHQQQGIGRRLVQAVKQKAQEAGLQAALLVEPDNTRALRLYRSEGFRPEGLRPAFGHTYQIMRISAC